MSTAQYPLDVGIDVGGVIGVVVDGGGVVCGVGVIVDSAIVGVIGIVVGIDVGVEGVVVGGVVVNIIDVGEEEEKAGDGIS